MRHCRIIWSSLLVWLLCSGAVLAQSSDWALRFMGFEEGLSHRNVYKIRQDSSGFLWFATFNGLNRYDGYQFKVYNRQHPEFPLAQDLVRDFCIHAPEQLWLAHPNVLSSLHFGESSLETFTLNPNSAQRGQELNPGHLQAAPDQSGLWLTLFDVQAVQSSLTFVQKSGEISFRLPLGGAYEQHPLLAQAHTTWVAANDNEVWQVSQSGQILDQFTFPYRGRDPQTARVVHLQADHMGQGFFALLANGQLFYRSNDASLFSTHKAGEALVGKGPFHTGLILENGDVWAAGTGLLYYWSEAEQRLHNLSPNVQEIIRHRCQFRQVFQDQAGVVWVASDFGALKLTRKQQLFQTYLSGGDNHCSSGFCSMRGIAEDPRGNLYFSYYNAIHRLNPSSNQLEPLFPNKQFMATPFGLTWFQQGLITGNGLYLNLSTNRTDTLLPSAAASGNAVPLVDQSGTLWLGSEQTLYRFDTADRSLQPYGKPFPSRITYLHEGQRSTLLWVGTEAHGIFEVDRQTAQIRPIASSGNTTVFTLLHDRVLSLYEDHQGGLWAGTARGLHRLDFLTRQLRVFTVAEGLHNDFINGILPEGDSCLWASTDNGLLRMRIDGSGLTTFFEQDGLPANEFNRISFYLSREGKMYFGGLNGVVSFFPGPQYAARKRQQRARLLLTSFSRYDGKRDELIHTTHGLNSYLAIQLSHHDKFFSFEFALADYTNPRENLYSYRLEGYDANWSDPSPINMARFNNIPAGKYQFQVRAARGNDIWTPIELNIPISIQQAYYKSPWFLLACLLILASGVFGFLRYRIYTIRKREQELERMVELRTRELSEEKQKSEDLLLNILPVEIAEELKTFGFAKAQRHNSVSVMFTDFRDFSKFAERMSPEGLVAEIDHCFRAFDQIIDRFGLEKIKTIGDAYMCVGGLGTDEKTAAKNTVQAALTIQEFMAKLTTERASQGLPAFEARIGIHSGPVVAGIVGIKKFAYDIWGDTVNIAARMEARGTPGLVNVSEATYQLVKDDFQCKHRGKIKAKNKGEIDMYYVGG